MKHIKGFEKFKVNERNSPAPAPTKPGTKPTPREKPSPPKKPHRPGKIEEPSVVPRPMAATEEDVIERLRKELEDKDETIDEFYIKNKKK